MSFEHAGKPCNYQSVDTQTGKVKTVAPPVNCYECCDRCGWNPAELKRRLKSGMWRTAETRLNYETGEIVVLPVGTKRLVFRRSD